MTATSHTTIVTDAADPRLKDYRDLTDVALRRVLEPAGGLYIAESAKVLARALAAGHSARSVLVQEKWLEETRSLLATHGAESTEVFSVSAEVAESVTGYAVHRGVLAAMHRPALPSLAEITRDARTVVVLEDIVDHTNVCRPKIHPPAKHRRRRIAVLEGLVSHENVGSAFRAAAALGVDAVLVTPNCADPLYRRSVRVSMGTVFQVPWTRLESWPGDAQMLKDDGYVLAGMTLGEGAITLDELVAEDHDSLALVVGTEGPGLSPATDALLDRRVTIPMMGGVDSLNVASAAAVAFYATR